MARLTLLRHGRAEWPEGRYRDFDRPLDEVGVMQASHAGEAIGKLEPALPVVLIHSAALRTTQTALGLLATLGTAPRLLQAEPALYEASPGTIHAVLGQFRAQHPDAHLLLVGHNPGISELARRLGLLASGGFTPGQWASGRDLP